MLADQMYLNQVLDRFRTAINFQESLKAIRTEMKIIPMSDPKWASLGRAADLLEQKFSMLMELGIYEWGAYKESNERKEC